MKHIILILLLPVSLLAQNLTGLKTRTNKIEALDQTKKVVDIADTLRFPDGSKMIKAMAIDTYKVATPYFVKQAIHDSIKLLKPDTSKLATHFYVLQSIHDSINTIKPDTSKLATHYLVATSIHDSLSNINLSFNGNRTITRQGVAQVNAGGTSIVEFLNNYFFPSTSPTASISGGSTMEYMSSGPDLSVTLNFSAGRPSACTPLQSIVVSGVTQTVNLLNEGQSQNGSLQRPLVRNTNTTYNITVTATDGKTATANTSVTFSYKRYWGNVPTNTAPTDADILALSSEFASNRNQTRNGINGNGNYLCFAFPTAWGTPVFKVNGLTSTAFNKVRDNALTNASGGTANYQVWISNTPMNSAIDAFSIE